MCVTTAGLSGIEIRKKTLQTKSNILWVQLVWIRHIIIFLLVNLWEKYNAEEKVIFCYLYLACLHVCFAAK